LLVCCIRFFLGGSDSFVTDAETRITVGDAALSAGNSLDPSFALKANIQNPSAAAFGTGVRLASFSRDEPLHEDQIAAPLNALPLLNEPIKPLADPVFTKALLVSIISPIAAKLHSASIDPEQMASIIMAESEGAAQDPLLITAIIHAQSGFNIALRSKRGEIGLMQISPARAEEISKQTGIPWKGADELGNPKYNIALGAGRLQYIENHYELTERQRLLGYHWDPDKLLVAINENTLSPDLTREFATKAQKLYEELKKKEASARDK